MFGNQAPHPPTFGKDLPKKTEFFLAASLIWHGVIGQEGIQIQEVVSLGKSSLQIKS